jgi:lysyl-tRNA synthetase, class II
MENPLFKEREAKMKKISDLGFKAYPERFERTHYSDEALKLGEKKVRAVEEISKKNKNNVTLCGRMMSFRGFGKLNFAHLQDDRGRIQICMMRGAMGEKAEQLMALLDVGDFIGATGELFKTKHGETTLLVNKLTFLGKAIRPLPEKWHGIQDQETKYRQRYLDMVMSPEAKKRFEFRSAILRKLREFYWEKGFTEIETPVLENISSGAAARPFFTHHNALDIDVYLRIAAGELWQKMAIVGGFEKTFEVARCFRNEGMDPSHLQEFTMVEHYAAFWNFEDNMKFTEEMFKYLIKEISGSTKVMVMDRDGKPVEIDFKTPWPRKDYREMIKKDCDIDILEHKSADTLLKVIRLKKIEIEDAENLGYGNLVDHLYKKVSRPKLIQPTFVIHHPADTKPLARRNDENPRVCDTFQLLVNTWEIVNAYSELVDPADQRARLESQALSKAGGDEEAMSMNEEYLEAMEHGMPPISGWGMGIDRLVTLLTQQDNLRDVVMFPLLKPLAKKIEKLQPEPAPKKSVARFTPESTKAEAGITYADARKILDDHVKDPVLINHSRESEVIMRALAKRLGENEDVWAIAGLLHDIDWEMTKNKPEEHCVMSKAILKDHGVSEKLIEVMTSHAYGSPFGCYLSKERTTTFEHALAAAETVTGLIYAYALMRPDKKLANVEVKSIKKKFKDKSFAANVNRGVVMECEQIGLNLDEFLQIALDAMIGIAEEIGL